MICSFLKSNEINKLKILSFLSIYNRVKLNILSLELHLSTTTIRRLLKSLSEDLSDLLDLKVEDIITIDSDQFITFCPKSTKSYNQIVYKIYQKYHENSVEFKIFIAIFIHNLTNILELCVQINISQSYCYSKIKVINSYLKKYHLYLKVENFKISINGPEENIHFLIYLSQLAFKTNAENINTSDHKKMLLSFNQSKNYAKDSIEALCSTFIIRSPFLSNLNEQEKEVADLLNIIIEENNQISLNFENIHTKKVTGLYNLLLRTTINGIDSQTQRQKIGEKFYKSEGKLISSMKKILNSYKSSFQTNFSSIEEDYELIYILGIHVCYLSIFKVDFQALFKQRMNEEVLDFLPMDDTDIEKELHTMVKNHLKNLHWTLESKKELSILLTKTLFTTFKSYYKPTIKIMIIGFDYMLSNESIKKQLLNYFSSDFIEIITDENDADLVITDNFYSNPSNKPTFIFYDHNSNHAWKELHSLILKIALVKTEKLA